MRSCDLTIRKLLANICPYKNKMEKKGFIEINSNNIQAFLQMEISGDLRIEFGRLFM